MTQGTYRPSYHALYRAALDEKNNLIAFHVRAGGIPESPLAANRFPLEQLIIIKRKVGMNLQT